MTTLTQEEQHDCEKDCVAEAASQVEIARLSTSNVIEKHKAYLSRGLFGGLGAGFVALDASRPWMIYWIIHAQKLLGTELSKEETQRCVDTLIYCQHSGFGGGPQQMAHCAPTYAAVLALCELGHPEAVDREALYQFFLKVKEPGSGGFRLHVDGEVDVRGTYTVIAVASLMNMLTSQLTIGVAEYVRSCQSYEGGFGGEPGSEAHGGYTFCAVATLRLLNEPIDRVSDLERWLCRRQMAVEGGFQGRTNKLVDVCYSFWQGCALQLVSEAQNQFDTTPCDPAALVKHTLLFSIFGWGLSR